MKYRKLITGGVLALGAVGGAVAFSLPADAATAAPAAQHVLHVVPNTGAAAAAPASLSQEQEAELNEAAAEAEVSALEAAASF
jgi:hypothetical protein